MNTVFDVTVSFNRTTRLHVVQKLDIHGRQIGQADAIQTSTKAKARYAVLIKKHARTLASSTPGCIKHLRCATPREGFMLLLDMSKTSARPAPDQRWAVMHVPSGKNLAVPSKTEALHLFYAAADGTDSGVFFS